MPEQDGAERRKWLMVAAIGAVFLAATAALAFMGSNMNPLMLAGVGAFAASCLGVGLIQWRATGVGAAGKPGSPPISRALGSAALLMAVACLLVGLAALGMEDAEFSVRYPRWMGIAAGFIGAPFFAAAGIYAWAKSPRR